MPIDLNPTVCLDGTAIRRIREEKKLTQLYVAKVVGVTTDTVSRWENNRYPSIKRDNALKLAEALEVSLADIVQKPPAEPPPLATHTPRRKLSGALGLGLSLLLLALGFIFLRPGEEPSAGMRAERLLPVYAAPGNALPVRIRLVVEQGRRGLILREHFPPGWQLVEASPPPSSLDNEEGTARWILKSGEQGQVISYLIQVPSAAKMADVGDFHGEVVANQEGHNRPVPISGAAQTQVAPYLWADTNGDSVVDDAEMLLASDVFDEMDGVPLDWPQLESIWDAGGYRWEEDGQRFVPARPLSPEPTPPAEL